MTENQLLFRAEADPVKGDGALGTSYRRTTRITAAPYGEPSMWERLSDRNVIVGLMVGTTAMVVPFVAALTILLVALYRRRVQTLMASCAEGADQTSPPPVTLLPAEKRSPVAGNSIRIRSARTVLLGQVAPALAFALFATLAYRVTSNRALYDFFAGRLHRRLLANTTDLASITASRAAVRDPDGLFRVETYYCFANSWRAAVARLIGTSTAVLMDLRGFGPQHGGCRIELDLLLESVPRVQGVLLVDASTDMTLLQQITSANTGGAELASQSSASLKLVHAGRSNARTLDAVLAALLPHDADSRQPQT